MKPLKRNIIILLIFVIVILLESVSLAFYQSNQTPSKQEESIVMVSQEEQETIDLVNHYREQNGLEFLKPLTELQEIARLKAEDIITHEYFSHTSPNLGTPFEMLKQNGVKYKIAGENLAGNTTPERAVEAWINSPSHRENMLEEKFQYMGICVMESPVYGKVFVQLLIGLE